MTTEQMKETLRRLHAELESGASPDPELRALLQTLEQDIHALLEPPADVPPADAAGVTDSIESAAVRFEVDHPSLAPALRQVGEALSRMGM